MESARKIRQKNVSLNRWLLFYSSRFPSTFVEWERKKKEKVGFSTPKTSSNYKRKHAFHTMRARIVEEKAKDGKNKASEKRSLVKNVKHIHTPHKRSPLSSAITSKNKKHLSLCPLIN